MAFPQHSSLKKGGMMVRARLLSERSNLRGALVHLHFAPSSVHSAVDRCLRKVTGHPYNTMAQNSTSLTRLSAAFDSRMGPNFT